MEEEFKKRDDVDHEEGGCLVDAQEEGMEGVGDFLDDVVEVSKKDGVVLDCSLEELKEASIPSWDIIRGEDAAICHKGVGDVLEEVEEEMMMENAVAKEGQSGGDVVQEGSASGSVGLGTEEMMMVASSDVSTTIEKERVVMNWKKAVVGGSEVNKGGAEENGAKSQANSKGGAGGGKKPSVNNNGGGPVKVCRPIVFNKDGGGFLDRVGETVHVDREAVMECEKSLERALVGRILGRPVPFGFLFRELKKKWSKFGKAHLSMVGRNSFVCFFASMEMRDLVLKGGPWFVGKQLVGIAKWSSEFDLSSIKGFSTPIWIRLPQLPLNLWSDQNLGWIASMIGEPLWIDEVTSSWGRTEFARVCVRIDFDKKLPKGLWIQGVERKFFQSIVYEGLDHICFHCGGVGHMNGDCLQEGDGVPKAGGEENVEGASLFFEKRNGGVAHEDQCGRVGGKDTSGTSTSVFGTDYAKVREEVLLKHGKEVCDGVVQPRSCSLKTVENPAGGIFGGAASAKCKEAGAVQPRSSSLLSVEGSAGGVLGGVASVECREDVEGGSGWTLVANKKNRNHKHKPNVGKLPRGFPKPVRQKVGLEESRHDKEAVPSRELPGLKPMLVYKRVGKSPSGSGSFSASHCLRALDESSGNPGLKSVRLKRPSGRSFEVGKFCSGWDGCGGQQGGVEAAALVLFTPASPSSPVLEGLLKRRRGEGDLSNGGDVSPLVDL